MDVDFEAFKQGMNAIGTALTIVKQAKDLLPDSTKKQEASQAIENAERQLKIAEAQTASAMRYRICKNHFPGGIMLSNDNRHWRCPDCGNEILPHREPKLFTPPS